MATVELRYDPKDSAWFAANATMVLKAGEPAYHSVTGKFKLGDGVTQLQNLEFLSNEAQLVTATVVNKTGVNLLANLAVSADYPSCSRHLLKPHWTTRMQFLI